MIIRIVGKHQLAAFQAIHHHACHLRAYCGATVAATDATMPRDPAWINIVSRMDHDGTLARQIVDPGLQTIMRNE